MAAPATATPQIHPNYTVQGIQVENAIVDPAGFAAASRLRTNVEGTRSYTQNSAAPGGYTDTFELRKSDILVDGLLQFSGTLTVTPGSGTVASTARWPYDMVRPKFTANGASNLIDASGWKLKLRESQSNPELSDRGVIRTMNGSTVQQGSLSLNSENWGVGYNTSALAAGTYNVELEWMIPISQDSSDMTGSIFLQTASADLTIQLQYLPINQLFALTGNAAVSLTGTFTLTTNKASIPIDTSGAIIIPKLDTYHQVTQSSTSVIAAGSTNETRIVGQGSGKVLLRLSHQVWSGAGTASTPLAANATNFGNLYWSYGTSEQPQVFATGQTLREVNEKLYGVDIGGQLGFLTHDFVAVNWLRDVVDMGNASELRFAVTIPSGVTLTNPSIEYVVESIFSAGQAA